MKFKIGDIVKIKKLSEEEFNKNNDHYYNYNIYLNRYSLFKNKWYKISDILFNMYMIWEKNEIFYLYEYELKLYIDIKTKIKFVKELIK